MDTYTYPFSHCMLLCFVSGVIYLILVQVKIHCDIKRIKKKGQKQKEEEIIGKVK